MTGVHGLQHIQRFFTADFADHDAVWTHTQTVHQQFTLAHRSVAFKVCRTGFEPRHVRLLELQFGRVFDGDDAFLVVDEDRECVEKCGFTGAGSAGDDNVQAGLDRGFQQFHHAGRKGFAVHQIRRHQLVGRKTADGE
jgi:hypothetical protein